MVNQDLCSQAQRHHALTTGGLRHRLQLENHQTSMWVTKPVSDSASYKPFHACDTVLNYFLGCLSCVTHSSPFIISPWGNEKKRQISANSWFLVKIKMPVGLRSQRSNENNFQYKYVLNSIINNISNTRMTTAFKNRDH